MPKPIEHETEEQFITRAIPEIIKSGATDNKEEAFTISKSLWNDSLKYWGLD